MHVFVLLPSLTEIPWVSINQPSAKLSFAIITFDFVVFTFTLFKTIFLEAAVYVKGEVLVPLHNDFYQRFKVILSNNCTSASFSMLDYVST